MLSRRTLLAAICISSAASWVTAQQIATFEEQLRAALKARRPVEFSFISKVVVLVNNDKLPKDLVTALMHYARKKHDKYPYPWFEQAVRIKAKELSVEIPE
jgi:hypothetical protein